MEIMIDRDNALKELLIPHTFSITQLKSLNASLESLAIVHTMKNNDVDDYLSKTR